jgi:transposase InsO family protein
VLEGLRPDATAGDPISGTKWTRKTLGKLAKQLRRRGDPVSRETVRRLLGELDLHPADKS